jgi:hypothetical protein
VSCHGRELVAWSGWELPEIFTQPGCDPASWLTEDILKDAEWKASLFGVDPPKRAVLEIYLASERWNIEERQRLQRYHGDLPPDNFAGRKRSQTEDYGVYLASPVWRTIRNEALRRDDFRCAKCGRRRDLEVHHLTYRRVGAESPEDLVTLCGSCHRKVEGTS